MSDQQKKFPEYAFRVAERSFADPKVEAVAFYGDGTQMNFLDRKQFAAWKAEQAATQSGRALSLLQEHSVEEKLRKRITELEDALREIEWAATLWIDCAACPFCHNLQDGEDNKSAKYPPRTHKGDCRWKALVG
jgi:hypothetical protein